MDYEVYSDGSKCGELTEIEAIVLRRQAVFSWGVWRRGVGIVSAALLFLAVVLMVSFFLQFNSDTWVATSIQLAALFLSYVVATGGIVCSIADEIQTKYLKLVRQSKGISTESGLVIARNGYA